MAMPLAPIRKKWQHKLDIIPKRMWTILRTAFSASMARELGREATLAELAERMKMSEDEIRDIMKLTMDAMKVSGQAAEMDQKEIDEQE